MREQLLGYLLGALEPHEQQQVEEHLEKNPEARLELEKLGRGLEPLRSDDGYFEPPGDLAQRTCAFVTSYAERAVLGGPIWPNRWHMQDVLVAAGIFIAASLLFFPAVQQSRFQARMASCQNNLRAIGTALANYSQAHGGYFPYVPTEGPLAAAGIYGPTLVESGYLPSAQHLVCPESLLANAGPFDMPTLSEVRSAQGQALRTLRARMGGSYGYTLGHFVNDHYEGTKNRHRSTFAVVADVPGGDRTEPLSPNHDCCGQNVLFEDGHVTFHRACSASGCSDNFFLNEDGQLAAGNHPNDSVISPSDAPPVLPIHLDRMSEE